MPKFDNEKLEAAVNEQADAIILQLEALIAGRVEKQVLRIHLARLKGNMDVLQAWGEILVKQQEEAN